MSIGTDYLMLCKDCYIKGIRPANIHSQSHENYNKIVTIAKDYFETARLKDFKGFLQEYQYNINLWTAHMILEYGSTDSQLRLEALKIIGRYSESLLDPELAAEEKQWFIDNDINLSD